MQRVFATWLLGAAWQPAFVAVCLGWLSPQGLTPLSVVAGALPVLVILQGEWRNAVVAAIAGATAVCTSLVLTNQTIELAICFGVAVYLLPLSLGALLQRSASLLLVFQVVVALAVVLLLLIYALLEQPAMVWQHPVSVAVQSFRQAGVPIEEAAIAVMARTMWGAYLALWMVCTLCAVFLGHWWQTLLTQPGSFVKAFCKLRVGTVLGLPLVAVLLLAMVSDVDVVDVLAWLATTAFAFQGLAAAHRQKNASRMNRSALVAIYVFLFFPLLSFVTVGALTIWGIVDEWWFRKVSLRKR